MEILVNNKDHIVETNDAINVYEFYPRTNQKINEFKTKQKKLYYYQKPHEGFSLGKLYSYILYSPSLQYYKRNSENRESFNIEKGIPKDNFDAVKKLAVKNNKNFEIFPAEMLESFKKNSLSINHQSGFSYQIYNSENELIAHASGYKVQDNLFHHHEINLLLRFIVDEQYRATRAKELLMDCITNEFYEQQPIYFQVFSNNQRALRFFLRRMNVFVAYERWLVE